jgi:hypothetical protein
MTNGRPRRPATGAPLLGRQKTWKWVPVVIFLFAGGGFAVWGLAIRGSQPPELYPEFQMFPSARTFDPPGSIFRVNRDGVRFDVADISGEITPATGSEDIPDQTGRRRVEGNVIGNLLKGDASGAVSAAGTYDVGLKLSGAVREKTSDLNLDKALSLVLKQVALRSDNRYYVIRETIAVREVDYELSTTDLESVAAKVGTKPVGDGKIDIRQKGSASTTLVGHYETPYRLFYKVEEVQFASSGLNGDLKLSRHPVTGTLDWHEPAHAE